MLKKQLALYLEEHKFLSLGKILNRRKALGALFILMILSLRILCIDRFPPNLSHDEVEYYLNSLSYWQNGMDLSGYAFPLSLFRTQTTGKISPLVPIIMAPYFSLVPMNMLYIRLPYFLINVFSAFLIYLLTLRIIRNKLISFFSFYLFLISPWGIFLSRWTAESPFALFFYLLGSYLLLSGFKHRFGLSFVFFITGFFSYHGAKLIFLPLIAIVLFYLFISEKEKNFRKSILVFGFSVLIFFSSYLLAESLIQGDYASGRITDIVFLDKELISKLVNEERRIQLENPFKNIFFNKLTATFEILLKKYLTSFSLDSLFLYGDPRATYRFGSYGLLHLFDFIFIPLGLIFLFQKRRKEFFFLVSLTLVSPLATALSKVDTSFVHRSFFLLPLFTIFSACGFYMFCNIFQRKKTFFPILILITIPFYFYFLHFYYFRAPIVAQENYFLSERVLAKYLEFSDKSNKFLIVDSSPREVYLQYIFETGNKEIIRLKLIEDLILGRYKYANLEFVGSCPQGSVDKIIIVSRRMNCFSQVVAESVIIDQRDSGAIFRIQKDPVCGDIEKEIYRRFSYVSDYDISNLDRSDFCKKWINKI